MKTKLIIVFFVALVLRLSVSLLGFHGDLNNNISWGNIAYQKGLNGFYEGYTDLETSLPKNESGEVAWPYSAPNQPPLTIMLFAMIGFVWQKLRDFIWYMNWELVIFPSRIVWFWDDFGMKFLVKLPSMLADLGVGFLLYKFVMEKLKKSEKIALIIASVWLFNPVVWYNSSVWGQTDSIVNLFGLLAIINLLDKKLIWFSMFFSVSFLFKGSLGTFIPVLVAYIFFQKYKGKDYLLATLSVIASVIFVSFWFHPEANLFFWLYDLYVKRILPGEIGFLTANSFNLWWLVDPGKVYDSVKYFGINARAIGISATLIVNILAIYWLAKKPNQNRLLATLMIIAIGSFLFMTRIHERYLYPFFPISTLFLGLSPGYWLVYIAFSAVQLLNLYNLFWVPSIPMVEGTLALGWVTYSLSVINIGLFLLTLRHLLRSKI